MSMLDIAVTRELIRALKAVRTPSRQDQPECWCPTSWPVSAGHMSSCIQARAAIHEARKAGY